MILTVLCNNGRLEKSEIHPERLEPGEQNAERILVSVTGLGKKEILELLDGVKGLPSYFRNNAEKYCDTPLETISTLSGHL